VRTRIVGSFIFAAALLAGLSITPTPATAQGKGGGKGKVAPADPRQSQPVPKLPNGKPDFSGTWDHPRTGDLGKPAQGCVGGTAGCSWMPEETISGCIAKKESCVPFTEFGKAELKKEHFDYGVHCLPWGYVRSWGTPYPLQIVQNNDVFAILFEQNNMFHIVPTSANAKFRDDMESSWMGESISHWDGDTLVVETKGFNGQTWLDTAPETPALETTTVVERFTRPDFTHIVKEMTVTDPKMYTKPWKGTMTIALMAPGRDRILEYSCDENNKEVTEGHVTDIWTKKK